MTKDIYISSLKHEKEYVLLLNSGKKVTAIFYKRRRVLMLPELSVAFNPSSSIPTHTTVNEKEYINTFFIANEAITYDTIDFIYIDNVAYNMVDSIL